MVLKKPISVSAGEDISVRTINEETPLSLSRHKMSFTYTVFHVDCGRLHGTAAAQTDLHKTVHPEKNSRQTSG